MSTTSNSAPKRGQRQARGFWSSETIALRSQVEGITWPAQPGPAATQVLALLYQLDQTQWWSPERLRARQLEQLALLARYAAAHSPFYRDRLDATALAQAVAWTDEQLVSLPLLTRTELLTNAQAIDCDEIPKSHGASATLRTSGSTGQLVQVRRTSISYLFWMALVMRDHLWHRRAFDQALAVIRPGAIVLDDDQAAREAGWGAPVSMLYQSGPCYTMPLSTDTGELGEWLLRRNPGYLLTFPTTLASLLAWFDERGRRLPNLREVRTMGEILTSEVRAATKRVLRVPVADSYSSQELGGIAIQCPASGDPPLYHVNSESLLVEVLDEQGRPCGPGEVGRVVVTDLHNFATPLIRYELRDYAEAGPPCPCGRGLPTLARILGRHRNMVVLPDRRRYWPMVGLGRFHEIASILQYQMVQKNLEEVEMRIVLAGAGELSPAQAQRLIELVQGALGHPFRISLRYFAGELPDSRGGKFEEFVSEVGG